MDSFECRALPVFLVYWTKLYPSTRVLIMHNDQCMPSIASTPLVLPKHQCCTQHSATMIKKAFNLWPDCLLSWNTILFCISKHPAFLEVSQRYLRRRRSDQSPEQPCYRRRRTRYLHITCVIPMHMLVAPKRSVALAAAVWTASQLYVASLFQQLQTTSSTKWLALDDLLIRYKHGCTLASVLFCC